MTYGQVDLGAQLAEGKTKIIFAHPTRPDVVYMLHKDGLTAGDGVRHNVLPGKGKLSCRTSSNAFYLLEQEGIATHYVGMAADDLNIVTRCAMVPLEVVMRRLATGSYLRRNPTIVEGARLDPTVVEFFLKDDARHDPLVTDAEILDARIAAEAEIEHMRTTGRLVFAILERAWAKQDVALIDLKIEFGRAPDGALLVADVIDNDSWRIWPGGDKNRMLDKQIYRNLPVVTDDGLRAILLKYAQVAEMTDKFVANE